MMATSQRAVVARLFLLALVAAAAPLFHTDAAYIESVAANVDGGSYTASGDAKARGSGAKSAASMLTARKHEPFVPLVAFQCGYRNKFIDREGKWRSDISASATCLKDKYDILKYCKRVYPSLDVTNIVEYAHESRIGGWCHEDSIHCEDHFNVRPYRCIVGEFVSESLQVPPRCRFSHINGCGKCNDYKYWSLKAESECGLKTEDETQQNMKLHSFSILDPCGLSMFHGVEFVCCPKSVEDKIEHVVDLEKDKKIVSTDEEYDDEDDNDDEEEDEDDDQPSKSANDDDHQDPYFKEDADSGISEHDRFRDAEERLEKHHRKKVTKVITQWSELFDRYNKMKAKDPKGAEEYKRVMTARFRKTVAALEEENREQRTQLEEVHDERMQSALNEKKRQATHDYRAALARQVGGSGAISNKNNVLRTLKNYVKAEERDRTHMLNRYRHLLRSDPEAAVSFEPILLHRLRYIDLRINGTLAMLHDFPRLERQVRPLALEFWEHYRRENTPEAAVAKEAARANGGSLIAGGEDANERLVRLYRNVYQNAHPEAEAVLREAAIKTEEKLAIDRMPIATPRKNGDSAATAAKLHDSAPRPSSAGRRTVALATKSAPTTLSPATTTIPEDSDEDQFDDDDEDETTQEEVKQAFERMPKPEKFDKKVDKEEKIEKKLKDNKKINEEESDDESDDNDNSESDEDDSEEQSDSASSGDTAKKDDDLSIAIEPIRDGSPIRTRGEPAYSRRHDALVAYNLEYDSDGVSGPLSALAQFLNRTNVALGMLGCALVIFVAGILIKRRASRHPGFVEVDVCTPEERHVAGLQVNGYENPTYAHFDAKA